MNRQGLHRIIRAAATMLGEDTVVIIGSQSILASFREFVLPDDATMSAEADILPFDDEDEAKADQLDGLLGEASHFYDKYGIYADGVSPWTASLPSGWDERLVRIEDPESGATGLCLHPEDNVPRRAIYAKGPPTAAADIARLTDKLARMREASTRCGRTNRDGTLCRNDRRSCRDHR